MRNILHHHQRYQYHYPILILNFRTQNNFHKSIASLSNCLRVRTTRLVSQPSGNIYKTSLRSLSSSASEITNQINYYVVLKGNKTGVLTSWNEFIQSINQYPHPVYKLFEDQTKALEYWNSNKIDEHKNVEENKKPSNNVDLNMEPSILRFDGGCRGNPGYSTAGWAIWVGGENSKNIIKGHKFLGWKTVNEAEYLALIEGLKEAVRFGLRNLIIEGDSRLVVKQVNREWGFTERGKHLVPLKVEALSLLGTNNFDQVTLRHIRRHKNEVADQLTRVAFNPLSRNSEQLSNTGPYQPTAQFKTGKKKGWRRIKRFHKNAS